jgi:transcriptional activator SPT7
LRANTPNNMPEPATVQFDRDNAEEEHQRQLFRELYLRSEAKIAGLFGGSGSAERQSADGNATSADQLAADDVSVVEADVEVVSKKAARTIDEDNYDDDEEEEEEDEPIHTSKNKTANALLSPSKSGSSPVSGDLSPTKHSDQTKED